MLVPVALHRRLFRHRIKEKLVDDGNRIIKTALVLVGLLLAGTTTFIVYVVAGRTMSVAVASFLVVGLVGALIVFPVAAGRRHLNPP